MKAASLVRIWPRTYAAGHSPLPVSYQPLCQLLYLQIGIIFNNHLWLQGTQLPACRGVNDLIIHENLGIQLKATTFLVQCPTSPQTLPALKLEVENILRGPSAKDSTPQGPQQIQAGAVIPHLTKILVSLSMDLLQFVCQPGTEVDDAVIYLLPLTWKRLGAL